MGWYGSSSLDVKFLQLQNDTLLAKNCPLTDNIFSAPFTSSSFGSRSIFLCCISLTQFNVVTERPTKQTTTIADDPMGICTSVIK